MMNDEVGRDNSTHVWIGRRFLPGRHGQGCRLLVSRRGKFLLRFCDGTLVTTVRGTFRRLADEFGDEVLRDRPSTPRAVAAVSDQNGDEVLSGEGVARRDAEAQREGRK